MNQLHSSEPPLNVTWIEGERFYVRSERTQDRYMVDLPENWCGCQDVQYRPAKPICKHRRRAVAVLQAARNFCEEAGIPFDISVIGRAHRD